MYDNRLFIEMYTFFNFKILFVVEWALKTRRRRGQGTGRMRFMKDLPRRFKNGFKEGNRLFFLFDYLMSTKFKFFFLNKLLGTQAKSLKATKA